MKKIGNAFGGIGIGFVLIIVGIILLWWNEGNNVRNLKTTAEMDKSVIDVLSDSIDSSNEGKLIATHGKLINEEELTDETFKVSIKTAKLERIVEMYQWSETSHTEDGDTTYTYNKEWSSSLIDSTHFSKSGYDNPSEMPFGSNSYFANDVRVGAFRLSSEQIGLLSTNGVYDTLNEENVTSLGYKVIGKYYTNSADFNNPKVGDVRISFVYNNSTDISVLAVQTGNTFTDFVSKAGKSESRIMDGVQTGHEMINAIKNENKILKWVLRVAGVLLTVGGFSSILKPISAIGGVIPLLGNVIQSMVGLISFILGLAVSLVVIAIAWIRFRPLLGIALLAVVGVLIYFLYMKRKSNTNNTLNNSNVNN